MTRDCLLSEKGLMKEMKKIYLRKTLVELTKLVLKNDIFNYNEKTFLKKEAQQLGQSLLHTKAFCYGRM